MRTKTFQWMPDKTLSPAWKSPRVKLFCSENLLVPEEKETETEYFQIHKWILSVQASFGQLPGEG